MPDEMQARVGEKRVGIGARTGLESPYVCDASARELKDMASQGLVKIVEERRLDEAPEGLISRLTFERLR